MSSEIKKIIKLKEQAVGHRIGFSRRELLSHGVFSFSAIATFGPSLFTKKAYAKSNEGGDANFVPFMCFDMAGGAALPANFLVGKAGGPDDLLKSYSTLGWNPRGAAAEIDRRFGLPMYAKSGLFLGLTQSMSAEAEANLRLGSVCHFSQLDSVDNRQNIAGLVHRLGLKGTTLKTGLGTTRALSGGQSAAVELNLASPAFVSNVSHLVASLRFGGELMTGWEEDKSLQMLNAVRSLSSQQIATLRDLPNGRKLEKKVREFVEESDVATSLDAREDEVARAIWNINDRSRPDDSVVVQATIARAAVNGAAGPSVWTLGGCDYHDGTRTTGDAKDLEMGIAIGRAVEFAHQSRKAFFFQLITDGSCGAADGDTGWLGDTNEGMQVFGYYNPQGAPEYCKSNMQVGHFNDAQSAERSTLVGADPRKASLVSFANYCSAAGKLSEFFDLVPGVFSRGEMEEILVFAEP